jgi:NADH/F420H2 dehydrogenase subunit C
VPLRLFIDVRRRLAAARAERFDVVYHLSSARYKNQRIRVKVDADEDEPVPSAFPVYPGADWFEREAYDLYGVLFSGHPDLRRILTDYGFEGHPLRKDFPLTGLRRGALRRRGKRVVYEPVEAEAGIPQLRLSELPGKAPTTCCPATRRRSRTDFGSRDPIGRGPLEQAV